MKSNNFGMTESHFPILCKCLDLTKEYWMPEASTLAAIIIKAYTWWRGCRIFLSDHYTPNVYEVLCTIKMCKVKYLNIYSDVYTMPTITLFTSTLPINEI